MHRSGNPPKNRSNWFTTALGSICGSYGTLQSLLRGQKEHTDQVRKNKSSEDEWLSRRRKGNQTFFSLWPELSENIKERRKNQGKSPFLELPFEIRDEIFRLAIGMELFHLVDMATRTGFIKCGARNVEEGSYWKQKTCSRRCGSPLWGLVSYHSTPMFERSSGFPALLLTCQQNYTQGVGVLYSSNVFEAEYPETVVSLADYIRPSLLQTIRFLQVGGSARVLNMSTGIDNSWVEMWEVICYKMKALRSLQVTLRMQIQNGYSHSNIWRDKGDAMLRQWLAMPVENLRGLKHFSLVIDAPSVDDRLMTFQDRMELLVCSSISQGKPSQFPELFNHVHLSDPKASMGIDATRHGPAQPYNLVYGQG